MLKRISVLIVIIISILIFPSCMKEYSCTCTFNNQDSEVVIGTTSRSLAQRTCDNNLELYKESDPDATCKLERR